MGWELQRRGRSLGDATSGAGAGAVPGKQTLTMALPMAAGDDSLHETAAAGVAGGGSTLPHADAIQRSFGRHDVGGIESHTGGAARAAATSMDAEAYATGNHVAFASTPSLHTAAHEAAHVIQQRGGVQLEGGVGGVGDVYERHADQVADRVVRGESAEALLDEHAGGGGATDAVQHLRLTVNRKDPADRQRRIQSAIDGQNEMVRALATLHVSADHAIATAGASPDSTEVKQVAAPDQRSLEENITRVYQSEFFRFEIELVSHPALDPTAGGCDPAAIGRARLAGPYAITEVSERAEGGDMGRASRTQMRWAPNPRYEGFSMPGAGPSPQMSPEMMAPVLGLSPDDRIERAPDRGGYVEQPAASSSPVVYFAPRGQIPGGGGFGFAAPSSPASFERAFDQRSEGDQSGWQSQSAASRRPDTPRKGSGRDPGPEMGGSAWSLNPGGRPPPGRGKLASHEWCHLIGDGDGGACAPRNLVIGTNQVNTEQLAMENGLRDLRRAFRELDHDIWIKASATGEMVEGHLGEPVLQARAIRYEVWVQPKNGFMRTDVHTHVMNADRDFISFLEFEALRLLLASKLDALLLRMRPHPAAQFEAAPWAFPPEQHADVGIPSGGMGGFGGFGYYGGFGGGPRSGGFGGTSAASASPMPFGGGGFGGGPGPAPAPFGGGGFGGGPGPAPGPFGGGGFGGGPGPAPGPFGGGGFGGGPGPAPAPFGGGGFGGGGFGGGPGPAPAPFGGGGFGGGGFGGGPGPAPGPFGGGGFGGGPGPAPAPFGGGGFGGGPGPAPAPFAGGGFGAAPAADHGGADHMDVVRDADGFAIPARPRRGGGF